MSDVQSMISYAPYHEDLIIAHYFAKVPKGVYVDIGAGHPIKGSLTKHLSQQGWRGIDAESQEDLRDLLAFDRPHDTVVDTTKLDIAELAKLQKLNTVHFFKVTVGAASAKLVEAGLAHFQPPIVCLEKTDKKSRGVLLAAQYRLIFGSEAHAYFASPAVAPDAVFEAPLVRAISWQEADQLQLARWNELLTKFKFEASQQPRDAAPAGPPPGAKTQFKQLAKSLDRAVEARLAASRVRQPVFDPGNESAKRDVASLLASYRDVRLVEVGPSESDIAFRQGLLRGYRFTRKAAKRFTKEFISRTAPKKGKQK